MAEYKKMIEMRENMQKAIADRDRAFHDEQIANEDAEAEEVAEAKKAAKGAAKGAKGTSAAEVAAYESPLPLTTSGVESVVIMID